MLFALMVVLAPLVLIAYVVVAVLHLRRPAGPFQGAGRAALTIALASFPVWCVALVWRLVVDPSSTAVVAIYSVPPLAALLAALVCATTWSLVVLVQLARSGPRRRPALGRRALAALVLVASTVTLALAIHRIWLRRTPAPAAAAAGGVAGTFRVASDPATAPGELAALARREEVSVRSAVAANPRTPEATLVSLAGDAERAVRRAVAANPAAPPAALAALSGSEDRDTRLLVAANPNAPRSVLERLARDPDEKVRTYVARALEDPGRR